MNSLADVSALPDSPYSCFCERATVVVSGPSGVGKTTVLRELLERAPWLSFSVSHTTRSPRTGEVDGVDYHFVSSEVFAEMAKGDAFVEHATVHGRSYGTSRKEIDRIHQRKMTPFLDIDVQGARSIRRSLEHTLLLMIFPPALKTLQERLNARSTDDTAEKERRLRGAQAEMAHWREYDYVVVNDDVERAVETLTGILLAEAHTPRYLRPEFTGALVSQ